MIVFKTKYVERFKNPWEPYQFNEQRFKTDSIKQKLRQKKLQQLVLAAPHCLLFYT